MENKRADAGRGGGIAEPLPRDEFFGGASRGRSIIFSAHINGVNGNHIPRLMPSRRKYDVRFRACAV